MTRNEFASPLLGEQYTQIVHTSGLPIYVFPKHMSTTFAYFAVQYGSQDAAFYPADGTRKVTVPNGVAHFLEHKLFENEDGSDAFARFAELGADANAYTSYDRTAYLFSCTEHVPEALEELLRFVTAPHFTEASVKKERGIIAEEIRMYDDNPWERGFQNLLQALYHKHPVRISICGSQASIQKITPKTLYECYRAFYTPEHMVLVVCGNVTVEEVLRAVDTALPADFVSRGTVRRVRPEEPHTVVKAYVEATMPVSKPIFHIGIKDNGTPDTAEARLRRDLSMTMLDEMLFSRSGRFYNDLFERGILTASYSSGYSSGDDFAFHSLAGEAEDPAAVLEELLRFLEELKQTGLSDEEFERCRRVLYADEIRAYDSTEEIAGRLLSFAMDGVELFACPAIIQSITKAEIEALLAEQFEPDHFSLSVILPPSNT